MSLNLKTVPVIREAGHGELWSRPLAATSDPPFPEEYHVMSLVVANTILAQLGGAGRLRVMIGAKGFIGDENSLAFRFAARGADGSNAFRVVLDPSDTYTIEFLSLRGSSRKVRATRENVYAEDLRPIFEAQTGLRLSL